MTDDLRTLHSQSLTIADGFVADVTEADLGRSTPCHGWRLADLLAHMIGQHRGFEQALRHGNARQDAYAPVPFRYPDWQTSSAALVDAFAGVDLDDSIVAVELAPVPLPNRRILGAHLLDTVVHTWDIARSVGRHFVPPADLLAATARVARALPDQAYGPGAAFGERLPTTGDLWGDTLASAGRHLALP